MTDPPVLECTGLQKRFGERLAVDGVGFTVSAGETYGLLGPNGAGKTTTISMVCGLLTPDNGSVTVEGRRVTSGDPQSRASIGLVPQDIALYPDLTGRENLRYFGRLQGLDGAGLRERVDEVLGIVGLLDRSGERVEQYSGGMKRRCNIAAGLLHKPTLLILDEPTVGVDPQSRNAILESIEALGGEGLAVVYTTHYMEEAERLCDRVGIIDEGHLVAEGTKAQLIESIGEHARIRLNVKGDAAALAGQLGGLAGVINASGGDGLVEVGVSDPTHTLAPLVEALDKAGGAVSAVDIVEPNLESVFLALTGKALRD